MKKFLKIFTAFAVFLFIFTACGDKRDPGKQEIPDGDKISDNDHENQISDGDEILDTDPENQVSDRDEISDGDPENQTPEREEYPGDGTEKYITFTAPYANKNNESDEYEFPDEDAVAYTEDMKNSKPFSDTGTGEDVHVLSKCRNNLCGLTLRFCVYDLKTTDVLWGSSQIFNYRSFVFLKNNNYAYFNSSVSAGNYDESKFRIIKFNDEPPFEDLGETLIDFYFPTYGSVSENNVIATRVIDRSNIKKSKIVFLNMNKLEEKVKSVALDFDYEILSFDKQPLTLGDKFWTSGCRLKKADPENGDQYYCYALPLDVSNPSEPKMGKRINIPGELDAISDDGEYFYTKTPSIRKSDNITKGDFYILKIDHDKLEANVVKKYSLEGRKIDNKNSTGQSIIAKNDVIFFNDTTSYYSWDGITSESNKSYDIKLFSAISGEELFSGYFENVDTEMNVQDGGITILGEDNKLYYISEKGELTLLSESFHLPDAVGLPQFMNNRIYIPGATDGIYSFDVK